MMDAKPAAAPSPRETEIDESGVDLAQIRAMLDLKPAERLARVAQFTNALLEIQALNGNRQSG